MATYPLQFPTRAPALEKLSPTRNQVPFTGLSGQQQTVTNYSQWALEWTWPRMTHAEAARCSAFLNSLDGQVGTFWYYPRNPRATGLTGKNLPSTAFAFSTVMVVQGWSAGQASNVDVGQFIQIGNSLQATQLVQVTNVSPNADSQGRVTIEFAPQLRRDYLQGSAVIFDNPAGVFHLTTGETPGYSLDPDKLPEFPTISAIEAL